ncbi:MAG: hypothetical protein ACRDCA_27890 [Serratia sp. (in: enterobacteria)]|uniref:hypothetical protein n=1 Tax=Serratia sp. (in: enterobacteria) TaxID=616 RepID=UPI003F3E5168
MDARGKFMFYINFTLLLLKIIFVNYQKFLHASLTTPVEKAGFAERRLTVSYAQ